MRTIAEYESAAAEEAYIDMTRIEHQHHLIVEGAMKIKEVMMDGYKRGCTTG